MSVSVKKVNSLWLFFGDVDEDVGVKYWYGNCKKLVKLVVGVFEDDEFFVEDYCSDDNVKRWFYICCSCI